MRDEYGIFRDEHGNARAVDGRLIPISMRNIREILKRVKLDGHDHICLLEYAEQFSTTILEPDTYSKAEIYDMVHGIFKAQEIKLDDNYKRLDDIYYPINKNINRLTTRMQEMYQKIDLLQRQNAIGTEASPSIDRRTLPSIDAHDTPFRGRLVTEKLLQDKLDEINFSLGLMKKEINQESKDLSEYTDARHGMQQRSIENCRRRCIQMRFL